MLQSRHLHDQDPHLQCTWVRYEGYRWIPAVGMPSVPPTISATAQGFWPDLPEDEQRYSQQPSSQPAVRPLLLPARRDSQSAPGSGAAAQAAKASAKVPALQQNCISKLLDVGADSQVISLYATLLICALNTVLGPCANSC